MTNEQRAALIAACDGHDDVRAVTLALQICATKARAGDGVAAAAIRFEVDRRERNAARIAERKRLRLEIAALMWARNPNFKDDGMLKAAETLIELNEATPTKLEAEP